MQCTCHVLVALLLLLQPWAHRWFCTRLLTVPIILSLSLSLSLFRQERFRTLTSSYYRGAQGVVLCYDVTRRDTFDNLEPWLQEVELYCPASGKDVVKLLVGNKKDKAESSGREVEGREAMDWARTKGMMFIECSAKTKEGIESVRRCYERESEREREREAEVVNVGWQRESVCRTPRTLVYDLDVSSPSLPSLSLSLSLSLPSLPPPPPPGLPRGGA